VFRPWDWITFIYQIAHNQDWMNDSQLVALISVDHS
jgi:hypothetical protein